MTPKIDLVTLTYNHAIEMNLLKLQAISLNYVDQSLINKIYIVYNDRGTYDFTDIINSYPATLRDRVRVLYSAEMSGVSIESSWFSQQMYKLLVAKYIESDYYLVLDGKNHFIRPVAYHDYFDETNRPRLFIGWPGGMIKFYYRCLQYYGIECPFNYRATTSMQLDTTTPYLMNRSHVLEMIDYIEKKENTSFVTFFEKNQYTSISEFYLYSTYLIMTKKIEGYCLTPFNFQSIMCDPTASWNTYVERCLRVLNNSNIKAFGLHREAVRQMDNTYKQNLLSFYPHFFDEATCSFIRDKILYLTL